MGIFSTVFNLTVQIVSETGYPGIFSLMLLEGMLLPIPSEAVMAFGGYLVFSGHLAPGGYASFTYLLLAGTLGNLVGSFIAYAIGYYGGKPAIMRFGKYVKLNESTLDMVHAWFLKYGSVSVFLTRLVPVFRTFISIPAGIAKMNRAHFAVLTFTGTLIWDSVLVYLGYTLGNGWTAIISEFDQYEYVSIAAFIAVTVWLYLYVRKKQRQWSGRQIASPEQESK